MANFNQFTGIGTLTRDVEIRQADLEDVFLEVMSRKQTATGALA